MSKADVHKYIQCTNIGQARQGEITAMREKYQIDVTCIQVHRIHHPEETVKHQNLGNGWMIIKSSAEKAEE